MVEDAMGEHPIPVAAAAVVMAIRSDKYQGRVENIRRVYAETLEQNGDHKAAKKAVDLLKKRLPAVQWSGTFTGRGDKALKDYSGLVCADLDGLDATLAAAAREKLRDDPHVFALFTSPTGTGLKVVFSGARDAAQHRGNFLAVKAHITEVCGLPVDEACKNIERLCFVSHDPEAILNPAAVPLAPVEAPAPTPRPIPSAAPAPGRNGDSHAINIKLRQKEAADLLGCIQWKSETEGFCECPNWQAHSTESKPEDTRVTLDGAPTVHCFHNSCKSSIEAVNLELRRNIGKAEPAAARKIVVTQLLKEREFDFRVEPAVLRPIYTLTGVCISTPANLSTITSAIKTGKSAVIGALAAAAMPHSHDADLLGFSSSNPKGTALLWFDSEQSPDDFWHGVYRSVLRAGLREPPPWLHAYCLTGLGCKRAWECVTEATMAAADQHGGVHSTLIDGLADLVADVNDSAESNNFVAELHEMALSYDCPIIGVIHFNPGGEKSRGHLGSQVERKAETNLALDKDADETTTIFSTKNRRAGIPKDQGPRFAFSSEAGMHVSVESREVQAEAEKREALMALAQDVFGDHHALRYTDIQLTVKKLLTVSDSTAERKVTEMKRFTVIKPSVAGMYIIAKQACTK